MTREEAIKIFNTVLFFGECDASKEEIEECLKMAIKAMEEQQNPNSIRINFIGEEEAKEFDKYLKNQQESILDKIKSKLIEEKECAYADFERYKVEYLGQSWEDALDSIPQDDFRYGMERCIEIIDKYKAESEDKNDTSAVNRDS